MPPQSTTSLLLSPWLSPLLTSSWCPIILTPFPLYISSVLSVSFLPLPSLSHIFQFDSFSYLFALAPKVLATDIEMMMPWIWCLNAIIPPPCSLFTSPPPSMLCREGGSLRETLAHKRICSHLKFPSGTAAAFSSSEPSNLLFFSSF